MKITKLQAKDLLVLKKYWKVYDPFANRLEEMRKGKTTFLIIWDEGKPIGHGKIIWKKIPVIEDMYIDKNRRSSGIGGVLLKRLESYARGNGSKKVRLLVEEKKARNSISGKDIFLPERSKIHRKKWRRVSIEDGNFFLLPMERFK
jgi:GNAT superfamily N-acetyltransferase